VDLLIADFRLPIADLHVREIRDPQWDLNSIGNRQLPIGNIPDARRSDLSSNAFLHWPG
jgi:hypothetical protein